MIDSKNFPLILRVITIIISIIGFVKNLNMSLVQRIYSTFSFINEEKKMIQTKVFYVYNYFIYIIHFNFNGIYMEVCRFYKDKAVGY